MLDTSRIAEDYLSLPSVPYQNRNTLPDCAGVYFVISDSNDLLYVGKSENIRTRWYSTMHHRTPVMRDSYRISYFKTPEFSDLDEIEKALINVLSPAWNNKKHSEIIGDDDEVGPQNIRLQVRIPEDLHARLTDLAKQRDQPLNTVIVKSIQAGVGENRTTDEAITDIEQEITELKARLEALEKTLIDEIRRK